MPRISSPTSSVKFRSHAPTTVAAVASRCSASRSSPVSWRTARSAAASSVSPAGSASCPANPCRARLQDSANATGQESSRLPRISTAKVPARRRRFAPAETSARTAARKASNAVESSHSRALAGSEMASGGWRVQNRGRSLLALISRFSRRTTTSSTRPRIAALISLVRVKRTGSSISSRPVNERVWPLCGVAERKSRCSNWGATRRSIRQSSLSSPKGDGIRLWHSSTIRRSQGRCGEPSGVRQPARNCSSTSGWRR